MPDSVVIPIIMQQYVNPDLVVIPDIMQEIYKT